MKIRTSVLLAACLLNSSSLAEASTSETGDPDLGRCIDAANGNDLIVRDCFQSFTEREDARMNVAWNRLMEVVGRRTEVGRALLHEQRAWLAYRDAACQHFNLRETLDRARGAMCLSDLVAERVVEIRDYTLIHNAGEY